MRPKFDRTAFRAAFVLLLALAVSAPGFAAMKMSPYLQAVTTNSIYVLVECDSTSSVKVEYGTTTAYGSSATTESTESTNGSTYIHNIKLSNLQPNTLYHYRVSQGGTPTGDYTFTTAVQPGTGYRFAWMADNRTNTGVHDNIASRIKSANPRFSLYGGDTCVDGSYNAWKNEFFLTNEKNLIANVPFFLAPGNHEGWQQNTKAFTQSPSSSSGTKDYYSFDYGDVHFVCINNFASGGYAPGSAQYNWVQSDLKASTKPWKIVFNHVPPYCSGGHGEDSNMKSMASNIFAPNKVDVVFNGHSHFYQHNKVSGVHYMIIGSAGAGLDSTSNASYTIKSASSYCYGIIDVTPTTFHLVVYNNNGSVIETLDLSKQPVTPTAPPGISLAMTSSAASAKPGDTVTYTITYKNIGTGSASNVVISSPVPANTTYVSGGTLSSGKVTWTVPTLAVGASGTVSYQVRVN